MNQPPKRSFDLSARRRLLLEQMLKEKGVQVASQRISPRPKEIAQLPLSFGQERMWVLSQLDADGYAYNIEAPVGLRGSLSASALERALNEVVQRHEVLRTTFSSVAATPIQVIAPKPALAFPLIDLRGLPPEARKAEATRLATQEARRSFDLERGPLLRATLIKLADQDHVLLITFHHIVFDGWSIAVFIRELATLYQAFLHGRPSPLPDLPLQYADYALWQREWLQGDVLRQQLAYWQGQLSGVTPLELPTARQRPALQTFRGAIHRFRISQRLTRALLAMGRRENVTPFMILLAAFASLLARYVRQDDICIGTPIANRNRAEIEGLIGFFINTLVMRIDLRGNPTVRELLQRVHKVALDAYAHQDLPFEKLVDELRLERNMSRTALFEVLFTFHNVPTDSLRPTIELTGLVVSPLEVDNRTAKFDLSLDLTESPDGLYGILEYNTDLFYGDTTARLIDQFQTLLSEMIVDLERPVAELPILPAPERHRLLVEFNTTGPAPRLHPLAHEVITEQARLRPTAIAAVAGTDRISYAALEAGANQIAWWLRKQGLGRQAYIGVCGTRGIAMLTSLLGIMKAGAVYVPLEPGYPDLRLSAIMRDCGIDLVLTEMALLDRMAAISGGLPRPAPLYCWDAGEQAAQHRPAWDEQPAEPPPVDVHPYDLANVFYTSGSTGIPKGAMIEHSGMLNHLWAKIALLDLTHESIVAQTAAHSFDISIWQFLTPLMVGGQVIIYDTPILLDPLQFLPAIERDRVTVVETVPTLLAAMLEAAGHLREQPQPLALPALTYMISNAETLPVPLARAWFDQFPHIPLINTYGATECSDDTTHYVMREALPAQTLRVPVGTPIAGFSIYVIDDHYQPLPIGCTGQVAMAGVGVGRGYLGDPRQTARVFVPNPFGDPGSRLYLTGDLGCWTADGQLEFIGRIDRQVKVRGYRIEPGEIEAALVQHPAVLNTVVHIPEDEDTPQLVAYVVAQQDMSIGPQTLRGYLSDRLPDYMIPHAFVLLAALPLNSNGKVDRDALPIPDAQSLSSSNNYVAPQTPLEEQLAAIWAEVLGIAQVGIEDDFFQLGGNSLHAVQATMRINTGLGVSIKIIDLFLNPTVQSLAAKLATPAQADAPQHQLQIVAGPPQESYDLSHAQRRFWFIDQVLQGQDKIVYSCAEGMYIREPLDLEVFDRTWDYLIQRHQSLHTIFVLEDGAPRAVVKPEMEREGYYCDLRGMPADEAAETVSRLTEADRREPFALDRGPLLRSKLFQLADDMYYFYLNMHHIITDGWSAAILADEFALAYDALLHQQPIPLDPLPVQYTDYARWEQQMETAGFWRDKETYLLQEASRPLPRLDLPFDRPRSTDQTHRGSEVFSEIDPASYQALLQIARSYDASLYMVLLTGYFILLNHLTQQDDIIVAFPVAGRTLRETEHLIGLFVNTLFVRIRFDQTPNVIALLESVREKCLLAYEHQDYPFNLLVKKLNPERLPSDAQSIFSTMLILENFPQPKQSSIVERVVADRQLDITSKFDLALLATPQSDRLKLSFEYNTELFYEATIQTFSDQYRMIIRYLIDSLHAAPAGSATHDD